MGLEITHGAFSGTYHRFDRLRKALCERACGGQWPDEHAAEWFFEPEIVPEAYRHGMKVLLNHADHEGVVEGADLVEMLDFLLWAVPHLKRDGGQVYEDAKRMLNGARRAVLAKSSLEFL